MYFQRKDNRLSFTPIYLLSSGYWSKRGDEFSIRSESVLCLLRNFSSLPHWDLICISRFVLLNWIAFKYSILFYPEMIFKWPTHHFHLSPFLHKLPDECSTTVLPFPFNLSSWYFSGVCVTCQLNCLFESHHGIKESRHWKQITGCERVLC